MPRAVILLLMLALAPVSSAQTPMRDRSPAMTVKKPDRTDAGTFDGTWFYANRDGRMALWVRTVDGKPELKLRYQSTASPEAFETTWDCVAEYDLSGAPARFSIDLDEADPDTLVGNWYWELSLGASARIEEGHFTMYRAGDGRQLVVDFDRFRKALTKRGRTGSFDGPVAWHFNKASKRLVLWDELPF